MRLIKYRDAGMHTYTYFWVDENERMCSPFFDSEKEAIDYKRNDKEQNETIPTT